MKNDWVSFATGINGKTVQVTGVPRIWPEHLGDPGDPDGRPPSNPNHAFEFHPLTRVTVGSKTNNFAGTIFAPDGFSGGLSESTAEKILTDTDVRVSESGGLVEIEFESGRVGNFTTFEINIREPNIEEVPGGYRVRGQVCAFEVGPCREPAGDNDLRSGFGAWRNSVRNIPSLVALPGSSWLLGDIASAVANDRRGNRGETSQ